MISVHRDYPRICFWLRGDVNEYEPQVGEVFAVGRVGIEKPELYATRLSEEIIKRIQWLVLRKSIAFPQ